MLNQILGFQKNKLLDILGVSEITNCVNTLNGINDKIKNRRKGSLKNRKLIIRCTKSIIRIIQKLN